MSRMFFPLALSSSIFLSLDGPAPSPTMTMFVLPDIVVFMSAPNDFRIELVHRGQGKRQKDAM